MSNSLSIKVNLNKKEKQTLLSSSEKKMYVLFQGSIFRCTKVGEIKDILILNKHDSVEVEILEPLKDTNFKDILEKEVKYLDIDRRYNYEDSIYFILRFNNEFNKQIDILKKIIDSLS